MAHAIVAVNAQGGIGHRNRLPWHCQEELALFRRTTRGKTLVVGRRTAETLPPLPDRRVMCVTRNPTLDTSTWSNAVTLTDHVLHEAGDPDGADGAVVIAGGAQVYAEAFRHPSYVRRVYLSVVRGEHTCDAFFRWEWLDEFVIVEQHDYAAFTHYVLDRTAAAHGERQYLRLLRQIVAEGDRRTGRNGETSALFKCDLTFDLRVGFPLLTTKKMFFRGVVEELLFFLRGETDTSSLSAKRVRIWEGNTSDAFLASVGLPYAQGVMGPMYGYQWRFFNAPYRIDAAGRPLAPSGGVDQLADVVRRIKTDPTSRRLLLTTYNPAQAPQGVLFPCHSITLQFYVQGEYLDMFCYNRSQDAFLGVPFNIASSALLLAVIAKLTAKTPRFCHMTLGDTHLYASHTAQVAQQLTRLPYALPKLTLPAIERVDDLGRLTADDVGLVEYRFHPAIAAEMVA